MSIVNQGVEEARERGSHTHLSLEDRLDEETRAKLDKLRGRR